MPVVFAANPLQPLIDFTEGILVFFHDDIGVGWGVSIILLTAVVRLALLPLTIRQFRSMQGLQRLAPEMKVLQEKYKDDRQRQQQEMMKLYREHKVNPLGSCLPLLLQLPVFLALFYMLREDLRYDICPFVNPPTKPDPRPCGETDASGFLFIPDLTNKATGAVLVALIVLYVGSQLASSLLMSVSADPTQRRIMIILPLIFVAFILSFPAGLIVYWITTNVWTIGQQWFIRRTVGPLRPAEAAATAGGGGGSGGRGGGRAAKGTPATAPRAAPPPPPRKRKKRSGRRR